MGFAHEKRLGRLSGSGFDRQIRGRSPRYGWLNLIRYIGLFGNQKGRLKTGFQTTFLILLIHRITGGRFDGKLSVFLSDAGVMDECVACAVGGGVGFAGGFVPF